MNNDRYSLFLYIAILAEIAAAMLLPFSGKISLPTPATVVLSCYACSCYFLARSLERIPLGLAYAVWAGAGLVAISVLNFFLFTVTLSAGATIGIIMIISGLLIISLLSTRNESETTRAN